MERWYNLVIFADEIHRMGSTFGALKASQPSIYESEEMRGQPSDHILLKPPDCWEEELLPEEAVAIKEIPLTSPKEGNTVLPTWNSEIT